MTTGFYEVTTASVEDGGRQTRERALIGNTDASFRRSHPPGVSDAAPAAASLQTPCALRWEVAGST